MMQQLMQHIYEILGLLYNNALLTPQYGTPDCFVTCRPPVTHFVQKLIP